MAGLLDIPGIDPETLQTLRGLQSMMGPSEEDKRQARAQALLLAGLGIMGSRKGSLPQDMTRAAMMGVQDYSQNLKEIGQIKGMNLGQAGQLLQMARQNQNLQQQKVALDNFNRALNGAQQTPMAPGPMQGFQAPGGAAGVFNAELGGMQQEARPLPTQIPDTKAQANNRDELAKAAILYRIAGGPDLASNIKLMYPDPVALRQGAALADARTGLPLNPNPEPPPGHYYDPRSNTFIPVAGGLDAITKAIQAKKSAEFPYTISEATGPGGAPIKGYAQTIFGPPPIGGQQQSSPQQTQHAPRFNFSGSPEQQRQAMAIAQNDLRQPAPVGGTMGQGFVQGPNPLAQRAVEKGQDIQGAGAEALNADWITKSYRPAIDQAKIARNSNAGLQILEQLPVTARTGWTQPAISTAARILSGFGLAPELVKDHAASAEMFSRAVFEHNWQLLQQQKGVQTEGDAQRAMKVFVQLSNRPESNQFIVDFAKAQNNLSIKQADFYTKALPDARGAGDFSKIENAWQQQQPSIWDDPIMKKWKEYGQDKQPPVTSGGWSYIGPKR